MFCREWLQINIHVDSCMPLKFEQTVPSSLHNLHNSFFMHSLNSCLESIEKKDKSSDNLTSNYRIQKVKFLYVCNTRSDAVCDVFALRRGGGVGLRGTGQPSQEVGVAEEG